MNLVGHFARAICLCMWLFALAGSATGAGPDKTANQHWAYKPLQKPAVPGISGPEVAPTPIDAFVAQKLQAAGFDFSPPADRRSLIRRAYFDLVGLPPSYEEIEAFAANPAPDAYAHLIDRLLASPQYGERWGRHWLDVARYADTKDLVLQYGKDRLRPYAYTYRDYVIKAFNEDTPFDQFIREQLAADILGPDLEPWRLAALGFLTLGRLYDNNPHDQIDDQIDTVTRGFLGLTVSCARCHDHKYDAIPIEDYYALYGVFASSERPYDLPLIEEPATIPGGMEFERKRDEALRKLEEHVDAEYTKLQATARARTSDYLVAAATTEPDLAESSTFFLSLAPEDLRPNLLNKWRRYLREHARREHPIFGVWSALMALPEADFEQQAQQVLEGRNEIWNPMLVSALRDAEIRGKADLARVYGETLYAAFRKAHEPVVEGVARPDLSAAETELAAVLTGQKAPVHFPRQLTYLYMSRVEVDRYHGLVAELDKVAANAEKRPPARAMVLRDSDPPYEPRVFVRGSPAQPGDPVDRRFLTLLAEDQPQVFRHGSGRLELAEAIASPDNPLTARVFVNRVWMHHLGAPLVSSPSDFGTRSEPPTHPELLDYLASQFIDQGWSVKKLHREIMLSRTYQQSSDDRPECRKVDPENHLLWRANRRRLELEPMRDTLLSAAGRLDATMGGPSVDVAYDPLNRRRTVYGLVDRQDLPAMYRAFDFVCPDQSVEKRPQTGVPQQALFALNSPFVQEQARAVAALPEVKEAELVEERVKILYRRVLGRNPAPEEVQRAKRFLSLGMKELENQQPLLEQFAQVLLISNEIMFVD